METRKREEGKKVKRTLSRRSKQSKRKFNKVPGGVRRNVSQSGCLLTTTILIRQSCAETGDSSCERWITRRVGLGAICLLMHELAFPVHRLSAHPTLHRSAHLRLR